MDNQSDGITWLKNALDNITNSTISDTGDTTRLRILRAGTGDTALTAGTTAATTVQFALAANGQMEWGSGTAARDTNLYRTAANRLKSDDDLETDGVLMTKTKAGIPTDADFASTLSGTAAAGGLIVDTTNHRLYVRCHAGWGYVQFATTV